VTGSGSGVVYVLSQLSPEGPEESHDSGSLFVWSPGRQVNAVSAVTFATDSHSFCV
jgi:hypothetical protein